ncbi:FimD/PapC N-terminal domain-containing protein, partial [Serratia quinivorans]|uniref:FimD/PapC N-terminal domain-containing protein n=1 Tax=Serratia quinivorans TaxID=137545 RepID=UPI0034C66C5F
MQQQRSTGIKPLRMMILTALALSPAVQGRDYFNPALLEQGDARQSQTDLSVFEDAGGQPPGTYRVDILLNERLTETRMVTFSAGVPSSQWDEGIPALILNYSLTGADTTARGSGQGGDSNSQFANL